MDGFETELMRRSPLAAGVLELCDFIFQDELLEGIWQSHRGRCYEDVLRFGDFLRLMRDALVNHGGSAHKLFVQLEADQRQPVDESNFYRKLARTPVAVSRALLREGTARLGRLVPGPVVPLAACFDGFEVVIGDGKKIKNATKRLKPTRGYEGKLIGAKALVGVDVRSGLAVAMSDSLDGMANDVPLVPALMEQLRQVIDRPILSVWDRQFDNVGTLKELCAREKDGFLVRMRDSRACFTVQSSVESTDEQGRRIIDQIVTLGRGRQVMTVRRITLCRGGEDQEDVILLSNLMNGQLFSAQDLLELYKRRWGIEQVFQQVTETFSLRHLIGSEPGAILFQFSFCLLLYNLMQVVKAYVAEDGKVLAGVVSMYYLFDHVRRELSAWAYHTDGSWPRSRRDAAGMQSRLRELMRGVWNPILYTKASDKKPRPKPKPKLRLHGGHTSVQRLLEGTAKVVAL